MRSSILLHERSLCGVVYQWVRAAGCTAVVIPAMLMSKELPAQSVKPSFSPVFLAAPNADQTSPEARTIRQELKMAGDYLVGKGVPRDPAQSAYWFKKAADQGDPGAQNQLGYMYVWGIGVERDNQQAFRWFSRAAGDGSQQAKLNLAVMYMKGLGVSKDFSLGIELLTELAAKKNARAEDYLGVIYLEGYGIPADRAAAEGWFQRAAKDRSPEGEYAMGQLYSVGVGHQHDFPKAAKLLRESARGGYVPAMYMLGVLLIDHPEFARSGEDVAWLERASEAGTWQSSATLGFLARDGRGVPQNMADAFRWFSIAVRQGGTAAEENLRAHLERCRAALTADQLDRELSAANDWIAQHPHADLFFFDDMRAPFPVGEVYAARADEAQ